MSPVLPQQVECQNKAVELILRLRVPRDVYIFLVLPFYLFHTLKITLTSTKSSYKIIKTQLIKPNHFKEINSVLAEKEFL